MGWDNKKSLGKPAEIQYFSVSYPKDFCQLSSTFLSVIQYFSEGYPKDFLNRTSTPSGSASASLKRRMNQSCSVFLMQSVDNDGEGAITSHVAGGAEGVHCDVKGNHQRLGVRIEAQYACHRP